jgi:hypothetical protein
MAVDHNGLVHKDYDALVATCGASPLLWPVAAVLTYVKREPQLFENAAIFGIFLNIFLEAAIVFCIGAPKQKDESTEDLFEYKTLDEAKREEGNSDRQRRGGARGGGPESSYLHKWFGKKKAARLRPYSCLKQLLSVKSIRLLVETAIVLWLAYFVFGLNMENIDVPDYAPAQDVRWIGYMLHLDQSWRMFSPRPPNINWWYIIQGWLVNGSEIEIHRNRGMWNWEGNPLDNWDKPKPFYPSYGNHRWFKFYEQMNSHPQNQAIRLEYGRFICREWNSRHSDGQVLYEFKIWWMNEFQKLDGTREERPKQLLWHHVCFDKKPVWSPPDKQ